MVYDLPASGRRLVQPVDGYVATVKSGEVTFEDGEPTGERPGMVVRRRIAAGAARRRNVIARYVAGAPVEEILLLLSAGGAGLLDGPRLARITPAASANEARKHYSRLAHPARAMSVKHRRRRAPTTWSRVQMNELRRSQVEWRPQVSRRASPSDCPPSARAPPSLSK